MGRGTLVWDLPTRLFHWTLVLAVAGCWWTGERGPSEIHALLGYAVLALLLFRLAWGLAGSETARFAAFVRRPGAAFAHLRHLFGRARLEQTVGHNPAGGYAVIALLLALAVAAVSGLFLYDDEIYWAPLNAWVSEEAAASLGRIHHLAFDVLLVLAAVHVAAVILYYLVKGLDLVRPMLSGRAELPRGARAPRIASPLLALVLAGAAVVLVWALVALA
jgi:cytochrome b